MMDAPIPFITTGEDGTGLSVNPQAKEILRQITKPMVIVSVVGMYRTGKSFLLNCLMGKTDGFPLGATVEAKTKGIWMWTGDFPNDPSKAMVLLDTEGLHDPEKGSRTHDAEIFTLAVLLSSILIYNSKGAIDSNSLDGLHLATELTNHISMKAEGEETGDEFAKFFPMLIWAVRDHHLELTVDGRDITAKEYLEKCLALKRGRGKDVTNYNALRETIRAFFKNRSCFLFPLPTAMDNLKNLEKLQMNELDPKFIKIGYEFTEFIFKNGLCKMISGKEVTGGMFSTLSEKYVEAIATGNVNIESAYDYMIQTENSKAIEKAALQYHNQMNSLMFPVTLEVLNKENMKAQNQATDIFLNTAVNNDRNRQYFQNLNQLLEQFYQEYVAKNHTASDNKCEGILKNLYKEIEAQVEKGEFTRPGGHASYKDLILNLEKNYGQIPDSEKGPSGQLTLLRFRSEKIEPKLSTLLQTDKALSDEQKKQEQLKLEIEDKERMKLLLEEQNSALKKQQNEIKESYENNLRKQKEEFARQHDQDMKNLQTNMKLAMEEKERLMKEGFEEHANLMQEELRDAKEDIAEKERNQKELQEKMKNEMDDKISKMKEEEKERVKRIEEMQAKVEEGNRGGGGLFSALGSALDSVLGVGRLLKGFKI
eukprot:GFUD01045093.1.p1 GENE.GFUD01045093.1~~GFUD01045093.1.p1  ORF type:complete len:651 (+),score=203.16 GFUD01045093.1:211-2163(+)